MNVGIFWLGRVTKEIRLAIKHLGKENNNTYFFTNAHLQGVSPIIGRCDEYLYDEVNKLKDIYAQSVANKLDFSVIIFGNGIPTSLEKLIPLFNEIRAKAKIWSFRIGIITSGCMRHPARIPFVDDHFIILNVPEATKKKFFDRRLVNSIHYYSTTGPNAVIQAMMEYCIEHDEYMNHYVAESSVNCYNDKISLKPFPYHLCKIYGFVTCYSNLNKKLLMLLRFNLSNYYKNKANFMYCGIDGYIFLKKFVNTKIVKDIINKLTVNKSNAFQKVYDKK
ncbi:hypothetical protein OAG73_01320 [bacterium]|nr:hypothetical protein [bacterium]